MLALMARRALVPVMMAALVAVVWLWIQHQGARIEALRAERAQLEHALAAMTLQRDQARAAARAAQAHNQRMRASTARHNDIRDWINSNDDAPVPPVLRGTIERLRR